MIGTVEGLRSYALIRGHTDVSGAQDASLSAALTRASDHITYHYLPRFAPGYDATSPNVVPATYEAAILEFRTPGFFSKSFTEGERKILIGVGEEIRWTPVKGGGGEGDVASTPKSSRVEDMLRPYIRYAGTPLVV